MNPTIETHPWLTQGEIDLIDALRSGQYEQYSGALRSGDSYCCLGVACDIYAASDWEIGRDGYLFRGEDVALTRGVSDYMGWSNREGLLNIQPRGDGNQRIWLTSLNDAGFTFSQIADTIEAGLVRKF